MNEKFLITKRTLTGLTKWMNEKFGTKPTGKPYTTGDVQGYVLRGHLPDHLGNKTIVKDKSNQDLKLYNVLK